MVGELIAGRYELEELVGAGGMSSVYRAHDRLLERDVAMKVLHEQYTADGEYVERFRREARAVAQLSHPNIVTVIDRGEQDGRQYIVFEYVDGENLKALVDRVGPLPEGEAIELALQVARALGFAHDQGLVHRDVKPQNVLLDDGGGAKVTDFGIARSLGVQAGLTQTGTVMGTSDYIAPEQARGSRVDAQSDVYSLGRRALRAPDRGGAVSRRQLRRGRDAPHQRAAAERARAAPRALAVRRCGRAAGDGEGAGRPVPLDGRAVRGAERLPGSAGRRLGAETIVVAPERRKRSRPPAERPSVWPLILLLAGLTVLAGILAALFTFTDSGERIKKAVGGGGSSAGVAGKPIRLRGLTSYDPEGDNHAEHNEVVGLATDGSGGTYWTTEQYSSGLQKSGVGLVLDAGSATKLSKLTVASDTPGFRAEIEAGSSPSGSFTPVSKSQTVGERTTFSLNGDPARYYVIWITSLGTNHTVHVNEVTARGSR